MASKSRDFLKANEVEKQFFNSNLTPTASDTVTNAVLAMIFSTVQEATQFPPPSLSVFPLLWFSCVVSVYQRDFCGNFAPRGTAAATILKFISGFKKLSELMASYT